MWIWVEYIDIFKRINKKNEGKKEKDKKWIVKGFRDICFFF